MVIDELVSLIRFDMPATSKSALAGVSKTMSRITDQIKGLGIVSAVTSGIFAAFSVNAAKDATSLANLSESIGVNMQEIEALGAVYERMGGSAKSFAADADAFKRSFGTLNIDKMVSLSEQFQGLSRDAAYQFGRAYGFSDDMIRVLRQGPDAVRSMAEEAKKYNTTNKQSLDNLRSLDKAWVSLKGVIGPVAKEVQGAFAPVLEGGLTWLANLLKENKDSIRETMNAIGESVHSAFKLIGGYAKDGWTLAKPYLIDGWKLIDAAATEAMKQLGPILESGWNAATKIITDAWAIFKPLAIEGWKAIDIAADTAMKQLGPILESGWNAATKIITDTWAKIKPEVEKGWQFIKNSAAEAEPKIEEITKAVSGYYRSLFAELSKIDFGSALKGAFDYLKPSDDMIATIKTSLGGIADSIAGFYTKIKEQVDGGALGRMWDSLKSIATSPLVQGLLGKLKAISETLSGITWTGLETAFKLVESIVGPTLETIEGLLKVLDGLANFNMSKIMEGIKGIAEAFAKAISDVFEKIIPDLLKKIMSKLPVVGDYFKEAENSQKTGDEKPGMLTSAARTVFGINALGAVADWWTGKETEATESNKEPAKAQVNIPKEMSVRIPQQQAQRQPTMDDLAMGEMMGAFDHMNGGTNRTNKVEYNQTTVSQFFFNLSSNLVETSKAQGALSYARSGNM